ncbi:MAG: hypothetical protein ACRDCW_12915 [Sarcina sp.]
MSTSKYMGSYKEKLILENCKKGLSERKENLRCEYIIEDVQCSENEYVPLNNIKCDVGSLRADCVLNKVRYIKVSGFVKDKYNKGVRGVVVSLLKQVICNSELTYLCKGDAVSDAIGYFQFIIYRDYDVDDYLVKVSDGDVIS